MLRDFKIILYINIILLSLFNMSCTREEIHKDEISGTTVEELNNLDTNSPETIPFLIEVMGENMLIGHYAALMLVEIGEDTIPYVIEAVKDEDLDRKLNAIIVLERICKPYPGVVDALIDILSEDTDPHVRWCAARALGCIDGSEAKKALPRLIKNLKIAESEEFYVTSEAIAKIGVTSESEAIKVLIEKLNDQDYYFRGYAVKALGLIGPEANAALPKLRELAQNDPYKYKERDRNDPYKYKEKYRIREIAKDAITKIEGAMVEDEETENN